MLPSLAGQAPVILTAASFLGWSLGLSANPPDGPQVLDELAAMLAHAKQMIACAAQGKTEYGGVPKFIERYGMVFDENSANDLNIELAAYRTPRSERGGFDKLHHFKKAWAIVWPNFQWQEWSELSVWAWCNYRIITTIGHTRSSKTFTFGHCALLDYLADPSHTATTLTTTKFDALKTRLWGDFKIAIETAVQRDAILDTFKVTDTVNFLNFGLRPRDGSIVDDRFSVQGLATDAADTAAGKIRGQHANRRRIIGDEAQDIADAIYRALLNADSATDFIGALLSNPVERESEFGRWCEPEAGWQSVTENDKFWETTKRNGVCLHFNALLSPNIKAGRTVFPFLATQDYIDSVAKNAGTNSLEWYMYVLGMFPPDGVVAKVWPSSSIDGANQSAAFDYTPEPVAALDPAFDYDNCVLILGKLGRLRDGSPCCVAETSVTIKTTVGRDQQPKEYQIAREVMRVCKEAGVKPENFIQDETGNGRGVLAILRMEWSSKVQGLCYGGEATDRPLRVNDDLPAKEQVRYNVSEIWFRASFLAAAGHLRGLRNLAKETAEDLSSRRYVVRQVGDRKLMVVESKDDMRTRLGRSPDFGDAFCQLAELMVRKGLLGEVVRKPGSDRAKAAIARARAGARRFATENSHGAA